MSKKFAFLNNLLLNNLLVKHVKKKQEKNCLFVIIIKLIFTNLNIKLNKKRKEN